MPLVALATYHTTPEGDSMLVEPLRHLGIEAHLTRWNDPSVDWSVFDMVVVRGCWDYHLQPEAFRAWIGHLTKLEVPLWNPPQVLHWNMDKRYLRDLAEAGVTVIPTVWIDQGQPADLRAIMVEQGWQRAIIKPCIGASAYRTWPTLGEHQSQLDEILQSSAAMVQEFMESIFEGEWSLVFFWGEYSHAMLKERHSVTGGVQHGENIPQSPSGDLIDQAAQVLHIAEELLGTHTLYARVDGIWHEGRLILMELELIEPELYTDDPTYAERMARVIAEKTPNG